MTVEQIDEISALAAKHGFKLAGFRSFERPLSLETIEKIKEKSRINKLKRGITATG